MCVCVCVCVCVDLRIYIIGTVQYLEEYFKSLITSFTVWHFIHQLIITISLNKFLYFELRTYASNFIHKVIICVCVCVCVC